MAPDPQPEAVIYVTEVSAPSFGDGGIQRLRSRMREPEPLPEPKPEAEVERLHSPMKELEPERELEP